MATVGEISSFGNSYIENLIINVVDGENNVISAGDITVTGTLFGSETKTSDSNGIASFLVLDSETLTITANDPVTGLSSQTNLTYTYSQDPIPFEVVIQLPDCGYAYFNSIFVNYFICEDAEVLAWCNNVYNKLEGEGIIPKYIDRTTDFQTFWEAVACFFAFIVTFARVFEDFTIQEDMVDRYLTSRGIIFNAQDTLSEKLYLVNNLYKEVNLRGTERIFSNKTQNGTIVNGELLRNIAYDDNDEFIFNLHFPHTIGWSVNNASPLYKGLSNQIGTNKSYENTEDFVDLANYPTFGNGTQAIITDGTKEVYSILNVPDTEVAGIGNDDTNFAINVDPSLDYEITFWVRQPVAETNLTFGLREYNREGGSISTLQRIDTLANESNFFENLQLAKTDKYYFVRGILYNGNATAANVEVNNIGGVNLKMQSSTGKIIPYIVLDNSNGGDAVNELRIWNLKVKPLANSCSTGFVNPKNFISLWLKHNNAQYSENQLKENLRRYLLPYNTSFKVNFIPPSFEEEAAPLLGLTGDEGILLTGDSGSVLLGD
tara:strand:+ start:10183 stop:11820 length:1638 start_codon:yes stop_codon:yes gene_type:complete